MKRRLLTILYAALFLALYVAAACAVRDLPAQIPAEEYPIGGATAPAGGFEAH